MINHPVWRFENQMPQGREFEIFHSTSTTYQPDIYQGHHFYEIYFLLRGSVRIIVDELDLKPVLGETLIFPPNCMHRITHDEPFQTYERFYIYLSKEYLSSISTEDYNFIDELEKLTSDSHNYFRPGEQTVLDLMTKADEIIEAAKDTSPAGIISNRCRMTMYLIHLLQLLNDSLVSTSDNNSSRMNDLIRFINQNAAQPLSLERLEEVFGISKYALLHEFKDYTGMPIYQYILTRRVLLAQQLIEQGTKPREACEQSGFTDYTSFYRAFKARTGKSPTQYNRTNHDSVD